MVSGLSTAAPYRLDLWRQVADGRSRSWAIFRANEFGSIDTSVAAAEAGTYNGVDVDGLFWSLEPTNDAPEFSIQNGTACIAVAQNAEILAHKCFALDPFAPRIMLKTTTLAEHGFIGQLALPTIPRSNNVVVTLSGSEGGFGGAMAGAYLANQGITSLAVATFGLPGLPANLERIPLEYFEPVFAYIRHELHPEKIILLGPSRGSELALLVASHYPEVQGVVGVVPGNSSWAGNTESMDSAAWTWRGRDIPFVSVEPGLDECVDFHGLPSFCNRGPFERALLRTDPANRHYIPIENINGPVLLLGAEDDQLWPSCDFGAEALQRLQAFDHPFNDKFLCFPSAGHDISIPSLSTYNRSMVHPFMGVRLNVGGTPQAMGRANRVAWQEIIEFVK